MRNETAFPTKILVKQYGKDGEEGGYKTEYHGGLTKRELFAAMAMQGFLANHPYLKQLDEKAHTSGVSLEFAVSRASVSYADAFIAELEK